MFDQGALFLIKTLFQMYIMILILRGFLQFFHMNYFNPVSQLVVKLTDPLVKPLRQYIPGFKGVDLSIVLLVFVLEVIMLSLTSLLALGAMLPIGPLVILSAISGAGEVLHLLFYLVLARVILSWVQSDQTGPIQEVCYTITEPMIAPIRKRVPPVSGFDLSPLILILIIQLFSVMFFGRI